MSRVSEANYNIKPNAKQRALTVYKP